MQGLVLDSSHALRFAHLLCLFVHLLYCGAYQETMKTICVVNKVASQMLDDSFLTHHTPATQKYRQNIDSGKQRRVPKTWFDEQNLK
uniref:Secreted protein n=1 Tax=Pyxicephalus adspersus TaxID=30357 RepID=A0AAV3AMM3_PYXAD|nr:TPA: hypothetical protein GDO54_010061 [Pyxicephalus adspersus]